MNRIAAGAFQFRVRIRGWSEGMRARARGRSIGARSKQAASNNGHCIQESRN